MPWTAADAERHTHLADTPAKKRQWAHVANNVLQQTGDDARAIRAANAAVHEHAAKDPAMRMARRGR
jgi:hypothetical protein